MGNTKRTTISIPHVLYTKAKSLEINISEATRKGIAVAIEDRELLDKIHRGELRVEPTA